MCETRSGIWEDWENECSVTNNPVYKKLDRRMNDFKKTLTFVQQICPPYENTIL